MIKKAHGFTIVELLIVIVVIAILAAISIVAYTGIQDRAKASQIISMYSSVDKAFRLVGSDKGWATWPTDGSFGLGANPTLAAIAGTADFSSYLQASVVPTDTNFRYDNDNDTYNGCSVGGLGVSIYTQTTVSRAIAEQVDKSIDDGNLSCGKVTWNTSNSEFKIYLSFGQSM